MIVTNLKMNEVIKDITTLLLEGKMSKKEADEWLILIASSSDIQHTKILIHTLNLN